VLGLVLSFCCLLVWNTVTLCTLSRYRGDTVACMVRLSFPRSRHSVRTVFLPLQAVAYATPGPASTGTLIFKILTLCRVYNKICKVDFFRESYWLGLAGLLSPTIMCFSVQSDLRCFDVLG
jgi:hypothetical protein